MFYKNDHNTFTHIRSRHQLKDVNSIDAIIGDYAAHITAPCNKSFFIQMLRCQFPSSTKFSRNQISEVETFINRTYYLEQEENILFGI